MEKQRHLFTDLFSWLVIAANVLFVLWILYNGISEGFRGTRVEQFSYLALMGLLAANAILLIRKRKG